MFGSPGPIIDIGINLTHDSFDADRDAVIARARDAGVAAMVVTGTTLETSQAAVALAAAWPQYLYATAGIHPHHASEYQHDTSSHLATLCQRPEVVAVGECGLDFFRDYSPRADQERAFEAQLALAVELQMPVFLHQRDAHARFVAILRQYRDRLPAAVAHCFTGEADALAAYLDLDLHIGITGWICDERRGLHLRDLVRDIPAHRLMLETDAPYLLPRDLHPRPATRRNESMWLPHILATVARCRGETAEAVARSTTAAACTFFGISPPPPSAIQVPESG